MHQETIATVGNPRVVIDELAGDAKIKGWDRNEVSVEGHGGTPPTLTATDDGVRVQCAGDCRIRVPHGAALEITAIRGDGRIGEIEGPLTLGEVSGDLRLRHLGAAHVQAVFGDVSAKGVHGDLSVGKVFGDALASLVFGDVHLPNVGADLRVQDVAGSVTAMAGADATVTVMGMQPSGPWGGAEGRVEVGGEGGIEGWSAMADASAEIGDIDIEVPAVDMPSAPTPATPPVPPTAPVPPEPVALADTPSPAANRAYDIRAGADIVLRVPPDVGVTVTATSGAGEVDVRVENAEVTRDGGTACVVLGDGAVPVVLSSGGSITLTGAAATARVDDRVWREMGEQFRSMGETWKEMGETFRVMAGEFAQRMEAQLGMMAGQLHERLGHVSDALPEVLVAAGLSDDDAERIAGHVRQAGERAAERAARHAERAARAVERQAEAIGRQAEVAARQAEAHVRRTVVKVSHGGEGGERPGGRKWVWRADAPPGSRAPEAPQAASSEERLMVLRMLEQGKISAAEAERLLAAIAGRAPSA